MEREVSHQVWLKIKRGDLTGRCAECGAIKGGKARKDVKTINIPCSVCGTLRPLRESTVYQLKKDNKGTGMCKICANILRRRWQIIRPGMEKNGRLTCSQCNDEWHVTTDFAYRIDRQIERGEIESFVCPDCQIEERRKLKDGIEVDEDDLLAGVLNETTECCGCIVTAAEEGCRCEKFDFCIHQSKCLGVIALKVNWQGFTSDCKGYQMKFLDHFGDPVLEKEVVL